MLVQGCKTSITHERNRKKEKGREGKTKECISKKYIWSKLKLVTLVILKMAILTKTQYAIKTLQGFHYSQSTKKWNLH